MTYLLISFLVALVSMVTEIRHGLRVKWSNKDNAMAFIMDMIFWPAYIVMSIFRFMKGRK
ncbi:hypothetical protein SJ_237 [Proteus phage SJ_PmiM]|nr:hypothetical protein SJ_237 [Proteus phage SJ_PmiM]